MVSFGSNSKKTVIVNYKYLITIQPLLKITNEEPVNDILSHILLQELINQVFSLIKIYDSALSKIVFLGKLNSFFSKKSSNREQFVNFIEKVAENKEEVSILEKKQFLDLLKDFQISEELNSIFQIEEKEILIESKIEGKISFDCFKHEESKEKFIREVEVLKRISLQDKTLKKINEEFFSVFFDKEDYSFHIEHSTESKE